MAQVYVKYNPYRLETIVKVNVTAESGKVKTYTITLVKKEEPPVVDPGDGDFDIDDLEGLLMVSYTKPLKAENIIPGWEGSHEFVLTNNSDYAMVYEIKLVSPDSTEELAIQEGKDIVTLITCHPYRVNTQRYIVRAYREK